MDRICIDELKIFAHHGVFEHENINGQNFYVNAVLYVETEKA
ncbi:MAG: dihydroneopterin aldolase, partial [Ruminococcus sp.]|nr:dihydroneopterin aldolase [Ruminococcus sp.]